ncbi:MAG TPA: single-stranded DNA-binding protein [Microbacterium sp.]|uniref:single-stranded DNA-binding protein n=1 Tax=Microbacterium sp. TaxID=51671 RepID=UPI002CED6ABA|nr:single-stranded DNA-binding protein [Microbacterium sp.]HWI30374.1 single-stranded DNA-binding protein [Microbacterium sp.]
MSDTITITGNIATPPERRVTPAGVVITSFRVASSQRRYDRNSGGWIDGETNWYTVSTFRALAEHAYESFHKGERVIATGKLRLREWDNGTKKGFTAEIDADAVGHDLLWGTSRFRKDEANQPPADPAETDALQSADPGAAAWTPPGSSSPVTEWDTAEAGADDPVAVDAPF